MEEKYQLAELVLPSDLLRYFVIVKIKQSFNLFHILLDKKKTKERSDDIHIKSKGFIDAVNVSDFTIRHHKVNLVLRRRHWLDTHADRNFSLLWNIDITASETRYSKEFGDFFIKKWRNTK